MKFFNTAGPVNPQKHYCLPPLSRIHLPEILGLIEQEKYFVLHAPRQMGKTSCLLALTKYLNETGKYRALYTNVEVGQSARENVDAAMRAILTEIADDETHSSGSTFIADHKSAALLESGGHHALSTVVRAWSLASPLPTVLMLDEVDSLVGDTLISLLRQIRAGYARRPAGFPQSIILCGVRDVRDYRIHSSAEKSIITGGSAFNIKAESLRLGNFSRTELVELYAQHTAETGQVFEPAALDMAWELSNGQPWVVNALAYEVCFRPGCNPAEPITADKMDQAKENLILRRETHLDQLADKLREPRVRRVIEPLLTGDLNEGLLAPDDVSYVEDLGLIRLTGGEGKQIQIANGIYREVIPRVLTYDAQVMLPQQPIWYTRPDGSLDMEKLLAAFQEFFREHSEHWAERFDYQEAWPQLLAQTFLHRIVNGGGQIHREYGLGRGRTDILVLWPLKGPEGGPSSWQRFVIELKVIGGPRWKGSLETTISKGVEQTLGYLDRTTAGEGHLIIMDRDTSKSWEQKIFRRTVVSGGKTLTIWGM